MNDLRCQQEKKDTTHNNSILDLMFKLIIIIPVCIGIYMVFSIMDHNIKGHNISMIRINKDISDIKNEISDIQNKIINYENEIKKKTSDIIDPGPEPKWYHWIDHLRWSNHIKIKNKLENEINELKIKKDDLMSDLSDKERMLDILIKVGQPPDDPIKYIWNTYIQPILHLFFGFTLCQFSLNRFCRYLLVKNYLKATKI